MIKAHTIRSENLLWVKDSRSFHADASTLCFIPGMPMPRRIEVVSARTGASAFYNLTDNVSNARFFNGRTDAGWFYKPDSACENSSVTKGVYIWNT